MNKNFKQLKDESTLSKTRKSAIKQQVIQFTEINSAPHRYTTHNLLNSISMALRKPAYAALAVVILLGALSGGTVYASQDALPGETLYHVKIATEKAQTALTQDTNDKAALHLAFAQRRVDELQAIINKGTVTPELVRETQSLLFALMEDVETMAHEIDDEAAIALAMQANQSTDDYVDAFKQIPAEYQDDYDDVAQHIVGQNLEHDDEFMRILMDRYEANPTEELRNQIQEQMREELAKELQYINMIEGGLNFAATVDSDSATFANNAQAGVVEAKEFAAMVERMINSPDFDPNALHELFDDANAGADLRHVFESVEDHFSDPRYEGIEYDGPWIDEGYDDFDAHAREGTCHTLDNETQIECFDGGRWVMYNSDYFLEVLLPTGEYDFEGREDYYDDRHDEFEDMPDDPTHSYEFDLIVAEFDKDGDGEVDCIGQEGCPGQEFFEKIFNRPCDEECQRMMDEEDRRDAEYHDEYDRDEEYYDDGNPDHFPPPANAGVYPDDEDYDPSQDPYSGPEFDRPHDEDGRTVQ